MKTSMPDPILPAVQQHLISPAEPAVARVVSSELCTRSSKAAGYVRHVAIDVSGTPLAGTFRAGQSFGVVPPGVDAKGRPHKLRLYSIASPTRGEDGEGTILATTVKRTIDEHWDDHSLFLGVCSNHLCDLKPGDEVLVTGPAGKRFLLPEDVSAHDYVFFATGTGIAPFRGMLGDLEAGGFTGRAALVMGVPYTTDLLYDAELAALSERVDWFSYLKAISRESAEPALGPGSGGRGLYVQDRLRTHAEELASLLRSERCLVYICGIAGMELGILRALAVMLSPDELAGYLGVSEEAGQPADWERRMIPRRLTPTKRLFIEVY